MISISSSFPAPLCRFKHWYIQSSSDLSLSFAILFTSFRFSFSSHYSSHFILCLPLLPSALGSNICLGFLSSLILTTCPNYLNPFLSILLDIDPCPKTLLIREFLILFLYVLPTYFISTIVILLFNIVQDSEQ